jgi:hypothetical protein
LGEVFFFRVHVWVTQVFAFPQHRQFSGTRDGAAWARLPERVIFGSELVSLGDRSTTIV